MLNKRAHWKVPYISSVFTHTTALNKKVIKIRDRNTVISAVLLSKTLNIYNGQKYLPIVVKGEMVGHKTGEFAITKTLGYKPKKKRKHK